VTAGIDWATADHAVAIVNAAGVATDRFTVPATAAGLRNEFPEIAFLHNAGHRELRVCLVERSAKGRIARGVLLDEDGGDDTARVRSSGPHEEQR
jgi:hypothetical protein